MTVHKWRSSTFWAAAQIEKYRSTLLCTNCVKLSPSHCEGSSSTRMSEALERIGGELRMVLRVWGGIIMLKKVQRSGFRVEGFLG